MPEHAILNFIKILKELYYTYDLLRNCKSLISFKLLKIKILTEPIRYNQFENNGK